MVLDMGLSKNRGKKPQNGWFISWKTLLKWDDLGGGFPLFMSRFGKIHVSNVQNPVDIPLNPGWLMTGSL